MILQVLPEARRVRVTLAAAAYLASIWFLEKAKIQISITYPLYAKLYFQKVDN